MRMSSPETMSAAAIRRVLKERMVDEGFECEGWTGKGEREWYMSEQGGIEGSCGPLQDCV